MTPASPPKQPTENLQKVYMSRLRDLKKDYDDLERSEENLLGMLERVRREEGYLVKALNDEVFTGQVATTKAPSTTTSLRAKEFSSHSEEQQTKKPPPPVPGLSQIETEATAPAKDTTATAIDNTTAETRISTRRKRRLARPMAQSSNTDTVRHLEVNRRAQRREERVLARQRLENALFAEDDDDSTSSSSS